MTRLLRKFRTFSRLSSRERALFFRVLPVTAGIRLALWFLPFRWIRSFTESSVNRRTSRPLTTRETAWAVRLTSRYVPSATCLTQALAAQILLNRAGIENRLHIGVARGDSFTSHAWLESAGRVLLGGAVESTRYVRMLTLEGKPL